MSYNVAVVVPPVPSDDVSAWAAVDTRRHELFLGLNISSNVARPVSLVVRRRRRGVPMVGGLCVPDLAGLHLVLRSFHIAAGALGLVAFWAAVLTKKGAKTHIRSGRIFVYCAYVVGVSAMVSCVWALGDSFGFGTSLGMSAEEIRRLAPERRWLFEFLGLAGISLLAYIQVGVYAVRTRDKPNPAGYWVLLLTLVTFSLVGVGVAVVGIRSLTDDGPAVHNLMPAVLGSGAVPLAFMMLRFVRRSRPRHRDWWCKHMECMLVSGIIFHTALAITISIRLLHQGLLSGPQGLIPWVLPTVIGVPVTFAWILYYKRRFRSTAPGTSAE